MTLTLALPRSLRDSFKVFLELEPNQIEAIADAIRGAGALVDRKALRQLIQQRVGLEEQVARHAAHLLLGLATLAQSLHDSPRETVAALDAGIRVAPTPFETRELQSWDARKAQVEVLLDMDAIVMLAKIARLAYDRTRMLDDARIITEVRPVFTRTDEGFPIAVASQVLRLHYSEDGENKSITMAMDEEDIRDLVDACNRALKKLNTVKAALVQSGVKVYVAGSADDE